MSRTALCRCTALVRITAWLSSWTPGRSTGGRRRSAVLPCPPRRPCLIGGSSTSGWREPGVGSKAARERREPGKECLMPVLEHLHKAQAFLQDAQLCVNHERYDSAVSRVYYAMFRAAIAQLEH